MTMWMFLAICVVAPIVADLVHKRMKYRAQTQAGQQQWDELAARMQKLEERVGNLETIVIEMDKRQRLDSEILSGDFK